MKKKTILSGLALLGSIAAVTFGSYFSERVIHIKKKDEKEIIDRDSKLHNLVDPVRFSELPKQEVSISSPNGYRISATVIRPYDSNRFVIFSHGVTETKMSSVKYASLFLERGFNAVIYDQRRHGNTGGLTTSYGYYEKHDLKAVVDWLIEQEGVITLGIHGESMGAATTLLYAGQLENRADFYIVDCPFSDFRELLSYQLKCEVKFLPPKLVMPIGNLFLKMRGKYSLKDVSPISVVDRIKQPILFIHSEKDDYILPYMTKDLYDRKKGEKMLFMAKNGEHAQSLNENRTEYEETIDTFLEKYVNNEP